MDRPPRARAGRHRRVRHGRAHRDRFLCRRRGRPDRGRLCHEAGEIAGPVSIALVASRPVDEQTAKAHLGQKSGFTNVTRHQDDARRCSLSRLDPSQT